ncbi:MAG: hypothetical protein IH787_08840 [Nitrospirae bacterium]|nr:hypothetical protein [Nitrospirota bacterium]
MIERTLRGRTAIVGIGETTYYKRGRSPDAEFKLAVEATGPDRPLAVKLHE